MPSNQNGEDLVFKKTKNKKRKTETFAHDGLDGSRPMSSVCVWARARGGGGDENDQHANNRVAKHQYIRHMWYMPTMRCSAYNVTAPEQTFIFGRI